MTPRTLTLTLATTTLACALGAVALFPRAFPILSIDQRLTVSIAEQKADSFALAHALPRTGPRVATRFVADTKTQIFLDLTGGADTVRGVARGSDHALYRWQVRRFTPGDIHETSVALAPDGRILGFTRTLADSEPRPVISADSAAALANTVLTSWLAESRDRWKLTSSSYDTKAVSNRIDRTFLYERTTVRLLGAPLRLKIVIGGDLPIAATRSVDVPQTFERRFSEMRASNEFYASLSGIGQVLLLILCILALRRFSGDGGVRWGPAFAAGGVIGALMIGAGLNILPSAWYNYDTATSSTTFLLQAVGAAATEGVVLTIVIGLTLAAAEAATRRAFPAQLDWWRWWEARGTRQVAGRVLGGYAIAAFGLLYVCLFYLTTRRVLGWWTPTEMLDDPNQIATRLPWLGGLAISLQAGVWEEAMFRVLPLSLLAMWARDRADRTRIMALGVVATALVFGFAHATYLSWPAYSRGVELFIESSLWAVIVLTFGPLPTMLGHFLFDFVLFNLFAGAGTGPAYRVTAAIAVVIAIAPAAVVLWRIVRQRGLANAMPSQSLGAWQRETSDDAERAPVSTVTARLTPRARTWAMIAGVVGVIVTLAMPARPTLGPKLSAGRGSVLRVADSALVARGVAVTGWTRLARVAADTTDALPRFLVREHAESLAQDLASSLHPPAWWIVRYVHPRGTLEQRAEEWRVRVWPDGRLMDVRHVLPDAAWRDSLSDAAARVVARRALTAVRYDTLKLVEAKFVTDLKSPNKTGARRKDIVATYTDTSRHLPGNALARAWVSIAGDEVTVVRRGIELPEAFLRTDRSAQVKRIMVSGALLLALVGILIGGVIFVKKRRVGVVDDKPLGRRGRWYALGGLGLLMIAEQINEWPRTVASYDTAVPWSSFVTNTLIVGCISLALLGIVAGLWLVFDGLRRRVGVRVVAAEVVDWPDTLRAAFGLVGSFAVITALMRWASRPSLPGSPSERVLDLAVPWLSPVLNLPLGVAMNVMLPAIALCVVLLMARGLAMRAVLVLGICLMIGGAVAAAVGDTGAMAHPVWLAIVLAGAVPVAYYALRTYAATSALTWFVAAVIGAALNATRDVLRSVTVDERVGAALVVVACGGLLVMARGYVERNGAQDVLAQRR